MTTQEAKTLIPTDYPTSIESGIQAVEEAMFNVVNSEVTVLRDASRHILSAGGKRLRPRLMLLTYLACGGTDVMKPVEPAAALELMHTASVVHDDINDHGVLRRGRPSVNAIWGRTFALLTGDFLFTAVYSLMAPYNELNVILARASTALVEGETLQAWAVKEKNFTSEIYARIISLKTAALFEAAAEIGALMAVASKPQVEALRRFGHSIGLAFQIVDDILDIVGDETKLGKTAGIDIAQGRGFASVEDSAEEKNGEKPAANDIVDSIKRKMLEGDRIQEAHDRAEMLVQMAISELDILPPSQAREALRAMAQQIIHRDR